MKKVVFRGPALTQSGYGVHSRQVARWLLSKSDVDVKFILTPWGDTPWIVNPETYDGLAGEIMKRSVSPRAAADSDVSFQLQLPNEWDPTLSKVNVGITAAVETDRCNPEWVSACNKMHAVVVPSQHAKCSITNTGEVTSKFLVIPEAFSDPCASSDLPSIGDFSTPFNFLVFGQLTGMTPVSDRKNVFLTIKWLCEVFKDDKDVGIVVKTNAGRNSKIDKNIVTNLFKQLLTEVRSGPYPKITLLHGDMSDAEVAALYRHNQVKALVSLTRGEGFGLPILEAAASGLPVIATGWSGHTDFLSHGKFVNIYYQLSEIHPSRVDNKIFMKGSRWANASEEDFKKRVAKFRSSFSTPQEWAKDLQKKVIAGYSFDAVSKMYDKEFADLL